MALIQCELCERWVSIITKHHLIPLEEGGKYSTTANICQPCHSTIHVHFSNRELAKEFYSIPKIKSSERLRKYLKWIKNKTVEKIINKKTK